MSLLSYLIPRVIFKASSSYNGEIKVTETFGRLSLEVGGLAQSGYLLDRLFNDGITKFKLQDKRIRKILLFGLAGGSVVKVLFKYFPSAQINAIDIDPVMVDVGRKHFGLDKYRNVSIQIADIFDKNIRFGTNYDLIIVDVFKGYEIPESLNETWFLNKLKKSLSKEGVVVFNRLYFQKFKNEADVFLEKLEKIYHDIDTRKIRYNILISAR